ncbi:MAG: GNAT family N-acetyltransferase [Planctomycetales bacterium]|nr:GNAT family N-acetyltransferase [Planctomycetales bacterium]
MTNVIYAIEPDLTADEFIDVLERSTLAARRPVDQPDRIDEMLRNAQIIVTARCEDQLIGISRAISDFRYCTYLSDLAVDLRFQRQGIGKRLIAETHLAAGTETRLILLAAPAAESYYGHIGMTQHHSCWMNHPGTDYSH